MNRKKRQWKTHIQELLKRLLEKAMIFFLLWLLFIYLSAPHILSLCRWLHFIFRYVFFSSPSNNVQVCRLKNEMFSFFLFHRIQFVVRWVWVCRFRFRLQMHRQLLVSSIAHSHCNILMYVCVCSDVCVYENERILSIPMKTGTPFVQGVKETDSINRNDYTT